MEKRWLLLARSNDFGERLERFVRAMPASNYSPFDPHSLLQGSGAAVFAKDKNSRMIVANPACLSLMGRNWSDVAGRNDVQWHTDRVQARQILSNDQIVIESKEALVYEEPFNTPLGTRIILSTKAPLLDKQGEIVGIVGVAKDITERKKREERAEFLRQEMAHRLKNSISLVQAMARQSINAGKGLSRFEGRLSAYSQSHDLIQRQERVPLHALIHAHLHLLPASDVLFVDGPNMVLTPNFVTQIGMALHELMTNSIKYGALGGDGRVDLRWHVETKEEREYLVLSWHEEHSGRHVPSSRQGFGHAVLTRAVA